MKYLVVDFIPYVIVGCVFLLLEFLKWRHCKKTINIMKAEATKYRIVKELMELKIVYLDLQKRGCLDEFPAIQQYLNEIPLIIDKIGFDANLDNVNIVRVKSAEQKSKVATLLEERERASKEVQEILDRKASIVNTMASVKNPLLHYVLKVGTRIQTKAIVILLCILVMIFIQIEELLHRLNIFNANHDDIPKEDITDSYMEMHFRLV